MRQRIVALSLVVAALAIGLFGVPFAFGSARLVVAQEEASLQRLADVTARSVRTEMTEDTPRPSIPEPDGDTELAVYDDDGRRLVGTGPDIGGPQVARSLTGRTQQSDEDGALVVTVPIAGVENVYGVTRAMRPVWSVYAQLLPSWGGMFALAVLVLALVWAVARRQAGRIAGPLEELEVSARRLGDGDFTVRTRPVGLSEIDSVGGALNDTAERLDDLLARERAFSSAASHQLRTPLAGLRLRLEAALDQPDLDPRQALADGITAADLLERTIDELLLLAREDARTPREPLDLPSLMKEIEQEWSPRLAARGRALTCGTEGPLPASPVSAAAARQILAVLLDNAEVHGAGAVHVEARESGDALAVDVSDQGRGLDADGPEPFAGPSRVGPHGIGLAFARRLAEAEGGRLVLSRPAPPVFTLLIPAVRPDDAPTQPEP